LWQNLERIMMEYSTLIEALYDRIELKRKYLNREKSLSDVERAAWGKALEWCYHTLIALQVASEAPEPPEIPEMPEGLECDECGD